MAAFDLSRIFYHREREERQEINKNFALSASFAVKQL
jgi:hypothetical protein